MKYHHNIAKRTSIDKNNSGGVPAIKSHLKEFLMIVLSNLVYVEIVMNQQTLLFLIDFLNCTKFSEFFFFLFDFGGFNLVIRKGSQREEPDNGKLN